MTNPLVRETQGHRIEYVDMSREAMGRLQNTFTQPPLRRVICACGWSVENVTMSEARATGHWGML